MFQYILKRILIFIPTFLAISLIIFGLSKMAPGDPVEVLLTGGTQAGSGGQSVLAGEEAYLRKAKELGLDKPVFYFSLSASAYPKDLYKISKLHHRELVSRLISKYGNSEAVDNYYKSLRKLELDIANIPEDSTLYETRRLLKQGVEELYLDYDEKGIGFKLDTMNLALKETQDASIEPIKKSLTELQDKFQYLKSNKTTYKLYVPTIHFYGFDNQYHTWMFGDYPWFQSVDSTDYRRLNQLYGEIAKLNNEQDSLSRLLKPFSAQKKQIEELISANDSTKTLNAKELDSLNVLSGEMQKEISQLDGAIAPLLSKMASLNTEKETLNKRIKIYASRGFLRGDFGTSYTNGLPVSQRLNDALFWTLIMNFFSIIISYLISIPLGVQSAHWKKNSERYEPLFSTASLIGASFLVLFFYLYLNNSIGSSLYYGGLVLVNLGFLFYSLLELNRASGQQSLKPSSILSFWRDILLFRWLRIADSSVLILKLTYLWSWALLLFVFLLLPIIAKILLVLFPLAYWGIRRLRRGAAKHQSTLKIGWAGITAKGSFIDNLSTAVLFVLYSLPSFWIGTLLIVFFTTDNYGAFFDWFPTSGVQTLEIANDPNASSWTKFSDIMYHLFLPIFCITYSSFAYLSRQMRGAMLGVMRQDYIRTAHSKGLSEHRVTWKHAFRNSLFPIITLFSSVFPRALSGAIAIELIYNVPGMGVLVLSGINERDWPIVFTVAMLAAILTMIGNLIADILYAVVDPRISFK